MLMKQKRDYTRNSYRYYAQKEAHLIFYQAVNTLNKFIKLYIDIYTNFI